MLTTRPFTKSEVSEMVLDICSYLVDMGALQQVAIDRREKYNAKNRDCPVPVARMWNKEINHTYRAICNAKCEIGILINSLEDGVIGEPEIVVDK